MIKKFLILILFFYFMVLLQASFLFGFPLVVIAVVLVNIFYRRFSFEAGIISAFIGGFFLDIFSSGILGFWVLMLLILSFCLQIILKKYVRAPVFKT